MAAAPPAEAEIRQQAVFRAYPRLIRDCVSTTTFNNRLESIEAAPVYCSMFILLNHCIGDKKG